MKKHFTIRKTISLPVFLLLGSLMITSAATNQYVLDALLKDSVSVYGIRISDSGVETRGDLAWRLPVGDTVLVERALSGNKEYALTIIAGNRYAVRSSDILATDGVEEDPWDTRADHRHSAEAKYFATYPPYIIIISLVVCALIVTLLGLRIRGMRTFAVYIIPILMIAACYWEVRAFITLGTDAFWWCDLDTYGFWNTTLRVLPFTLLVAFQLMVYPMYKNLLSGNNPEIKDELSIKPMAVSFVIALPIIAFVTLIAAIFHCGSLVQSVIGLITLLAVLCIGSAQSMRRNVRTLGIGGGIAFSVFCAIYIVGAMVAVLGLVITLLRVFVQILITLLPWLLILMVVTGTSSQSEIKPTPASPDDECKDRTGARWSNKDQARRANWRYERQNRGESMY